MKSVWLMHMVVQQRVNLEDQVSNMIRRGFRIESRLLQTFQVEEPN